MNKEEEIIRILTLMTKKYVLPLGLYDTDCIKEVLGRTFLLENKPTPIIESYSIGLDSILVTNINPDFNMDEYLHLTINS